MSSSDGWDGHKSSRFDGDGRGGSLETMLFESLAHLLIEKGLLTRNDALSIVQTVAQVKRGQLPDDSGAPHLESELALLRRIYDSFEALPGRSGPPRTDGANVLHLRPLLHPDAPEFPPED